MRYIKEKTQKFVIGALLTIASSPSIWAYSVGLPIFDMWTLWVNMVFGGFWLSVLGLGTIMALILMFGGTSKFTIIGFEMLFIVSMATGWGYMWITIPVWGLVVFYAITQFAKLMNSSSGY